MKFTITEESMSNARDAHVTTEHDGRLLLGQVVYAYREYVWRLRVNFFNGEPWPVAPLAQDVEVLERRP